MPCLEAFNRKWVGLASDDMVLPEAIRALATGSWLAGAGMLYHHWVGDGWSCEATGRLLCLGGVVVSTLNLGVLLAIIHTSLKGTVINPWPRRHLGKLYVAKFCVEGVFVGLTVLATDWVFRADPATCPADTLYWGTRLTQAAWLLSGWTAFSLFGLFASSRSVHHTENFESQESVASTLKFTVSKLIHYIAEKAGLEDHMSLNSVAALFSGFFRDDITIPPSDHFAALILLEKQQDQRRQALKDGLSHECDISPAPSYIEASLSSTSLSPHAWMCVPQAAHYMRFAAGAYGWPMFIFRSPVAAWGLGPILKRSSAHVWRNMVHYGPLLGLFPRGLPDNIHDDNGLLANTTVIKMTTGLTDADLVYVTFHNKLFEVPFYVALDHKFKSIVVAIRGTLSLEDILTDLVAFSSEEITVAGLKKPLAHEGMLKAARYILGLLVEGEAGGKPLLQQAREQLTEALKRPDEAQDYNIVITGHSLGAGVAAILALLINQLPEYHSDPVRCFAYSPPGGLVSLDTARYAEAFTCSVILGDDIVPRLGLISIFNLKLNILRILKTCDTPKHFIYASWVENVFYWLLGRPRSEHRLNERLGSWHHDQDARGCVQKIQAELEAAIQRTRRLRDQYSSMFPAGCVMYIEEKLNRHWCKSSASYRAMFLRGDSKYFDEILLTSAMIDHHVPWKVLDALSWMDQEGVEAVCLPSQ